MLSNIKSKRDEGFTIIEVLIVLAIAGLILLIVFLAVPALQRSSRNTQRKNDAAAIGGAIANFISNNGGTVPTLLGNNASASNLDICNAGGGATGGSAACTGNLETAKMGFYTQTNVTIANGGAGSVTPALGTSAGNVNPNTVVIEYGESCSSTASGAGGSASARTAAIFYATENGTSANGVEQCVEQ